MIRSRLQIANGEIIDTFDGWGFIYMDADERTEAPIKTRETTSYAEEAGEYLDPRTVQDAFDYKVKFLIECPNKNLQNANEKIEAFNKALYTQAVNSDIRTYKEITFYNDYNRVKIVGFPEPIAQPTDFYRRQDGRSLDCAQVELKIRVCDPTKCNFNMLLNEENNDSEPNTTTDALGIEWYNTQLDIGEAAAKISKPISINPERASYVKEIDGEKIYYYSRNEVAELIARIATYYDLELVEYAYDPITFMTFVGLATLQPVDFRTVWQPSIVDGEWLRGDIIASYPQMGYFKNGVWQPDDVYFLNDDNNVNIIKPQIADGEFNEEVIEDEDVAIPIKILIPVSTGTNGVSTLSLAKNFKLR